jgi:hypothetical protein
LAPFAFAEGSAAGKDLLATREKLLATGSKLRDKAGLSATGRKFAAWNRLARIRGCPSGDRQFTTRLGLLTADIGQGNHTLLAATGEDLSSLATLGYFPWTKGADSSQAAFPPGQLPRMPLSNPLGRLKCPDHRSQLLPVDTAGRQGADQRSDSLAPLGLHPRCSGNSNRSRQSLRCGRGRRYHHPPQPEETEHSEPLDH